MRKIILTTILLLLITKISLAQKYSTDINTENLKMEQKKAIADAAQDISVIFNSPTFKQKVISKKWIASCELTDGKVDEISGEEVYNLILNAKINFSVLAKKPFRAIAKTNRADSSIKISPKIIDNWYSKELLIKSNLVNTLSHEIMHIISEKFKDRGHGKDCPNYTLVSYEIGNLVEELWICNHL